MKKKILLIKIIKIISIVLNLKMENEIIIKKLTDNESQIRIINIGNSCYINSIIQILLHTPIFIEEFIMLIEEIKKMPMPTSYNFLQIYHNIKNANDYKKKRLIFHYLFIFLVSIIHNLFYTNIKIKLNFSESFRRY